MSNDITIVNTLELPSPQEWQEGLNLNPFKKLTIDISELDISDDMATALVYEDLQYWVQQHNNKAKSLNITYVLLEHYYDKGIPDDEWISWRSGGIDYMPHFQPEHWYIRDWFHFFVEIYYYRIFSLWDSVVGFINIFYQMHFNQDISLRKKVLKELSVQKPQLYIIFTSIKGDPLYNEASEYRNNMVHNLPPTEVIFRTSVKNVSEADHQRFLNTDSPLGNHITTNRPSTIFSISPSFGEYITTKKLMDNIINFTSFSGDKLQEIMSTIKQDRFAFKPPPK